MSNVTEAKLSAPIIPNREHIEACACDGRETRVVFRERKWTIVNAFGLFIQFNTIVEALETMEKMTGENEPLWVFRRWE